MNQSKKYDPRLKLKWLLSGAIQKQPINGPTPFIVDAVVSYEPTGWFTISCLSTRTQTPFYFVTKHQLELGTCSKFPKDALDFDQGIKLVEYKMGPKK